MTRCPRAARVEPVEACDLDAICGFLLQTTCGPCLNCPYEAHSIDLDGRVRSRVGCKWLRV